MSESLIGKITMRAIGCTPAKHISSDGKVTAIAEDHIDLVELVSNGTGGWMEHQAKIALGEK